MPKRKQEDDLFEVEKILSVKKSRKKTSYLVKWKGYNETYNTWEPRSSFQDGFDAMLRTYKSTTPSAKAKKKPRTRKSTSVKPPSKSRKIAISTPRRKRSGIAPTSARRVSSRTTKARTKKTKKAKTHASDVEKAKEIEDPTPSQSKPDQEAPDEAQTEARTEERAVTVNGNGNTGRDLQVKH
ncbi:hypothetical protein AAMO2058_000724700 [Amorphochlora amoebiformis]